MAVSTLVHVLTAPDLETIMIFKNEYGAGFTCENCVVDPISFKIVMSTNKNIEMHLTSKFGNDWKNELPPTPFGVKLGSL